VNVLPNFANGFSPGTIFCAIREDKQLALLRKVIRAQRFDGLPRVLGPVVDE
jgi:hypothetical protein